MLQAIKTLLICILIGLAFGLYLYVNFDPRPQRIFLSVISSVSIGSLMMLVIYHRHYVTAAVGAQSIKVLLIIVLLVLAALLGSEITFGLRSVFWPAQRYRPFQGGNVYVLNILVVLVAGIPIYVSEEWKNVMNSRLLIQQYRLLQLEQQQTAFELELLRAKINPHFLYNVHNTIAGLISKDPPKAEQMVLLLSKFFRFTLNKSSAAFHSAADELDIIRTYLDMQQIRYEDKMVFSIQAGAEVLALQLPSFILQPLVENAVKHGIERSTQKGFIEVDLTTDGTTLTIIVADSGPCFDVKPGEGLGLQMVTNKLKLLYETDFKIELINTPRKYVRLTLPATNQNRIGR
jgi:two-component system LytT family sensor kinase